jgi:hypothetical protein
MYIKVIFKSKSHSLKLFGTKLCREYSPSYLRIVLLTATNGLIIAFVLERGLADVF